MRAQVSLFAGVGLFVLITLGVVFYFISEQGYSAREPQAGGAKEYVEACMRGTLEEIVGEIAMGGGTLAPKGVRWQGGEINSLAFYLPGRGIVQQALSREFMQAEIEREIKERVTGCIRADIFRQQGYSVSVGEPFPESYISDNAVEVDMRLAIVLEQKGRTRTMDRFSVRVQAPLGMLQKMSADIINSEAQGWFDKEEYMLTRDVSIEKHRPYPHTVYVLEKGSLRFRFAITGRDTVASEVLKYSVDSCCEIGGICYNNAAGCSESDCTCQANVPAQELAGGRDCEHTYNYAEDDFSNPPREHGTSWCVYESMAGKGLDYVGTRHYVHSCIDGREYVEECRDYREELCVESGEKAKCRANRWHDCYSQTTREDCENQNLRDCVWADYLWTEKKCHPDVPPGLKFWEPSADEICSLASMDKNSYGQDHPMSWGYSSLLYCQRAGDCGNYRNYADVVTEFGYYNPDGKPDAWVYWDDGYTKRGDDFLVKAPFDGPLQDVKIPRGASARDAVCSAWKAPANPMCGLCNNSMLHPCTEYRCKSLGASCVFESGSCILQGESDDVAPSAEVALAKPLVSVAANSSYYADTIMHTVYPEVPAYAPVVVRIQTDEPCWCMLSLRPRTMQRGGFTIPEIQLGTEPVTEFEAEFRLPAENLTGMSNYHVFIRCSDQAGNHLKKEHALNITVFGAPVQPEIIGMQPGFLFVNKPFRECYHSGETAEFAAMKPLNCSAGAKDIVYNPRYPLGSHICRTDTATGYYRCADEKGNIAEAFSS